MFKFMKYEFRKQAFSKLVLLILAGLLELLFLYGIIVDSKDRIASSFALMSVLAFGAVLFVSFECIHTYSSDLKTKCGYMLFMTPYSSYTVIGAKVLSTVVQIILTSAAFVALLGSNALITFAKYEDISQLFNYLEEMFKIDIKAADVIFVIASLVISWILIVITAFFAITLSSTFLSNRKGKGLVSFIIFLLINWAMGKITALLINTNNVLEYTRGDYVMSLIYTVIFAGIVYVGTAWMLDKKVSL